MRTAIGNLKEQGHDVANRNNANDENRKVNRNAFHVQDQGMRPSVREEAFV